jgi:hypothetical protein
MIKRTSLPSAALVVALFALLATFGGAAVAAKTIGKNLVVTKSIKNNAVTGAKVKDGSLTAADLAAGTIPTIPTVPAPTNGKAAVFGSALLTNVNAGAKTLISPFGPGSTATTFGAVAPVNLAVADLRVVTLPQTAGASIQVSLVTAADFTSVPDGTTTLMSCNVPSGSSSCSSTQTGTIPAGAAFWFVSTNGPSGTTTNFAAASYTMKVQ